MSKRPFTLILPYYENPVQLWNQYEVLRALPSDVRQCIHLIVCDDGSPEHPAIKVQDGGRTRELVEGKPENGFRTYGPGSIKKDGLGLASHQMFRVDVDVRWNWLTCRNIGVHHAKTDWVLLTDIDHELLERTARRITERKLDASNVYRFSRVDKPDFTPYKPHPNSWLMTREMFDKIGGYDERFSGYYGTDGEFRDRVVKNCSKVVMLEEPLVRVPREVVADASTTKYLRKQPEDHEGVTRVRARIAKEGGRPHRLTFPYHDVSKYL